VIPLHLLVDDTNQFPHHGLEELTDQLFFAAEVIVERPFADVGAFGDLIDTGEIESSFRESGARCLKQLLARDRHAARLAGPLWRRFGTFGRHGMGISSGRGRWEYSQNRPVGQYLLGTFFNGLGKGHPHAKGELVLTNDL